MGESHKGIHSWGNYKKEHVSHSLNSLKGRHIGDYIGEYCKVYTKGY